MVKREDIKPGQVVKVVKEMPGSGKPGPSFSGKLGLHERLEVLSKPGGRGGVNLVKVRRRKTSEEFEALYAFVTNFCSVDKDADTPSPSSS
jgi:hypothetical protein